jgi:hypothetical protein
VRVVEGRAGEPGTLIVGWFSFDLMGATAGDLIAKDIACEWLKRAGLTPEVAMWKPSRPGEVATESVVPDNYDRLVFVCGPIGDGPPLNTFLDRFPHARKYALNVSMLQERSEWNPFEAIAERDSSERTNPDISFAASDSNVPVVGLILVGPQDEYPTQRHDLAEKIFDEVLDSRDVAVVRIDTRLDVNPYGLRTPAQVESLIAKMDAVLTTRLHGAAFALRRGVPPVVIDSIPGGTKVRAQMERIGWPLVFDTSDLHLADVAAALDYALTTEVRSLAVQCADRARAAVAEIEQEFLESLQAARTSRG